MSTTSKCAFVAIVGEPNAGKSTLLNSMIEEKVSIVSPKAQTTRSLLRGVATVEDTQLVFVDTPGFCKPTSPLEKVINSNFKTSYKDSDVILLVIDATSKNFSESIKFVEKFKDSKRIFSVVINKVDIARKEKILELAKVLSKYAFIERVFMVSALTADGLDDLKKFLRDVAPEGPWLFDQNQVTDSSLIFRISEITREKLFYHLEKELPYCVYVETEFFHESEKKAKIFQSIVVMKESQKGIVLGKGGSMIKTIKEEAIRDLKNLLNKKIELKLFVKVKEKWTEKVAHLKNAGILS